MRRITMPLAAALTLTGISVLTARAHSGLETDQAAPGAYKAVIRIPHGCDGQATNTVHVVIPEGYIGAKPMAKPGWTVATVKGDYAKAYSQHGQPLTSGVKEVTWSGGDLPDDLFDDFILTGTLDDVQPGQKLYFKTTQTCATASVAWDQEPADGQDAHSLEHPAPSLTIVAASGGEHEHAGHSAAVVTAGDLEISSAWARAMLPGQPAGGGYLSIANKGKEADRLLAVSSPAAGKAEVHEMKVVNDVMVMRPVEGALEIPAGSTVELKPGDYHLMFMQVAKPFAEGDEVKVTLEFEKAGKVDVSLPVRAASGEDHSNH